MENPIALENKLNRIAWGVTVLVLLLVGLMRRVKIDVGIDFHFLPPMHASLNSLTAIVLLIALIYIKSGNVVMHKRFMLIALGLSVLFLLSYVAYHFTTPETLFGDLDGNGVLSAGELELVEDTRGPYLVLLFSHITLAAVSLPFILLTVIRSWTGQFERHKKMARYVFPIWFYVVATGPICYLLLQPYYA